jgi:hypothetical protein
VDHPLKGGFDERSYTIKGGWGNCNLTSYRAGSFQMVSDLTYPPPDLRPGTCEVGSESAY